MTCCQISSTDTLFAKKKIIFLKFASFLRVHQQF